MKTRDKEVFALHSEVCKALANPKRLEIIHTLAAKGRQCASEPISSMQLTKTNLSQHVRVLKLAGIIESEREGVQVCYRLASPKIGEACELLREFLYERVGQLGALIKGEKARRPSRQ